MDEDEDGAQKHAQDSMSFVSSGKIKELNVAESKCTTTESEGGWSASRSALDVKHIKDGDSRTEFDQPTHCGASEKEPEAQPATAAVSTPAMSLEKSRRSYADVAKPIGAIESNVKANEMSVESLTKSDAVFEKARGIAQNLGMTLRSAVSFLNPFSSGLEENRRDCFEITWDVLFRPEIMKEGWKLQICLEYTSVERMVHLSAVACAKGDKIHKATGRFHVPMSEAIRCSYFLTKGSEKKRLQESTRLISTNSLETASTALTLDILDDISIFKKPQLGLQDLFNYRLNHFLENVTAFRSEIGPSISLAISRLDHMLSIKVTSDRVRTGCEERFGHPRGAVRMEIRRVVAEWCATAVIDSRDKEQTRKSETCIFCSTILGYFNISSEEVFKSTHRVMLANQCFEEALGSKVQADRSLLMLDTRCQELTLAGVALVCNVMVQSKFYGWMALLYLLDLDSEDKMIFANVRESSSTSVRQDTINFAEALQRSGLTREDRGARLVLKHVPSISALLKDPNMTALFRSDEIAARLAHFIPRADTRTGLSRELQLVVLDWLTAVSTSADKQVFGSCEAQSFNALLSTIFCAQMTLGIKIDYMIYIANILAKTSGASIGQDLTNVLGNTLHIISNFVTQLPKPASFRLQKDKNDVLRSVWSQVFEVEAMLDGAVANPPLSSALGHICRTWLNEVDDKEFVQLFAYILDREKDRNGIPNRKLSTRLRRWLELRLLDAVKQIVSRGELGSQRYIWDQLFGWFGADDSIPRVLSSLLLEGCRIGTSSCTINVLQSLTKWDLWELYLPPPGGITITSSLSLEAQSIIKLVQTVIAETKMKVEKSSLLVSEAIVLISGLGNIENLFDKTFILGLTTIKTTLQKFQERKLRMQVLYNFSAVCSADCLPEIKQALSLDANELRILEIRELYHTRGEDEARMLEKLPTLMDSKCFCHIWETADWSIADSSSLSSLCETVWKPCLKDWELLIFKMATRSIALEEVLQRFQPFSSKEIVNTELRKMEKWSTAEGSFISDTNIPRKWSEPAAASVNVFFRFRPLALQSNVVRKLIRSLSLEQKLQNNKGFGVLCDIAKQDHVYLSKPLQVLSKNIEQALEPLSRICALQVECLETISNHEKLVSWLQENEATSPEKFGEMIQFLTGCVEEPQDLERVSAMHSVHSRLYGICCLSTSTETNLFEQIIAQLSEIDVGNDLCEKIVQCSQDLEWFDVLRKKGMEGVGAESIRKMTDFLDRGQLKFGAVDGSICIFPNLSDLRDVHSRVALLLPPDDCEFSGKLARFGEILALAEAAERALLALIEKGSTRLSLCTRDVLLHQELENFCIFLEAEQDSWTRFLEAQRTKHFWINFFSIKQLAMLASCAENVRLTDSERDRAGRSSGKNFENDSKTLVDDESMDEGDDDDDPQVRFLAEAMSCPLKLAREALNVTGDFELAMQWVESNLNQGTAPSVIPGSTIEVDENANDVFVLSLLKCIDPEINQDEANLCLHKIIDADVSGGGWLNSIESMLSDLGSKQIAASEPLIPALDSVVIGKISLRTDVPHGRTIEFLLSIFCNLNLEPNPEYVLLCNKETTFEMVSLIFRRAFSHRISSSSGTKERDNSRAKAERSNQATDVYTKTQQLYCIAGVERLETAVHDRLADLVQRIMNEEGEYRNHPASTSFKLYILSEGSCRLVGRLAEMNYSTVQKSLQPVNMALIASSQSWAKHVKAIFSPSGTGKTSIAHRRAVESRYALCTIVLRSSNFCEIVSSLSSISIRAGKSPVLLHIEVSGIFKGDLDAVLFDLLVLGMLKASNGQVWHRSSVKEVILEIPNDVKFSSQILNIINQASVACTPREIQDVLDTMQGATPSQKHLYCIGKTSGGKYNLDPCVWKNPVFQRAARYLYYHQNNLLEQKDPLEVTETAPYIGSIPDLPGHECLHAILEAIRTVSDDVNPTWEAFTVFWKFFGSETARFSDNCFLQLAFSDDLPGFRGLVFGQFLQTSRDFVTNALRMNQDQRVAPDLKRYAPRKVWGQQNLSYIITHQDYFAFFNLRIAGKGQPCQVGEISLSEMLYSVLKAYDIEMNPNYNSRPRISLLRDLAGILNVSTRHPEDPDPEYILTLDNLKKMMAIHLRMRADLPVVIQGETGCGKTLLVKYLVSFIKARFKNMRVHGGTTADEIRTCVQHAEVEAKSRGTNVVIFFDEINCTSHMDMFKEIVCDRCLDGLPLSPNLKVIAACNPYLKLPQSAIDKQEAMGLGFRSDDIESLDGIPLRHLVYRVSKLPDSMLHHLWDFGALTAEVESTYIRLIVNSESSLKAESNEARCFSALIQTSQRYMRQLGDESSFVSMRDYRERAIPVFKFFTSFFTNAKSDIDALAADPGFAGSRIISPPCTLNDSFRSMFLSLYFSYESRLNDLKRRTEYRLHLAQEFLSSHASKLGVNKGMTSIQLAREMENDVTYFQDLLMCEMRLPEGIASCSMLKENVMMMAICIELNIPLFLVGKPGTSKSLAKKLVSEAMKGNRSCARLFRHLKCATLFSYQCSPHSTSEDIQAIWDKAVRFLERKDRQTFTAMVVLDEIGLAEDSSLMPLKVLHPLLERPSIGFVGLSNWAIDPAKMNRGVVLSRSDPLKEDLICTALGIAHDVPQTQSYLLQLTDLYMHIYENCQPKRDFYGLRDFFSMIKMLRFAEKYQKRKVTFSLLKEIVERNFGGSVCTESILQYFVQKFSNESCSISPESSISLISKCLERAHDRNISGRYLLIQAQNPDAALQILYSHAGLDKREVDVISGSNFPNDRGFGVICGHLRKVRLCMATDRTLVCKDLEACLEALYDLLNQFFTQILGKRWVDIGLGNERMQCPVGDRFRVIILAKDDQVATFPIPLLNRLEKHRLRIEDMLDTEGHEVVANLTQRLCGWQLRNLPAGSRSTAKASELLSLFLPGFYSDTIPSLVACSKRDQKCSKNFASLETFLVKMATPEFVLLTHDNVIQECYFEKQSHASLSDYIQASVGPDMKQSIRSVVTTYDTLPAQEAIKGQVMIPATDVGVMEVRYLEDFKSQIAFEVALRDFRKNCKEGKPNFLVLIISAANSSGGIICQSLQMLETHTSFENGVLCHVIVVLKLLRLLPRDKRYHSIFDNTWDHVYIDSLVPVWTRPSPSVWDFWRSGHLSTLCTQLECKKQSILADVLQANLQHAMARLASSHAKGTWQPLIFIRTLQQVLSDENLSPVIEARVLQILIDREKRAVSPKSWIENLCQNHGACLSVAGTLSRAIKVHVEAQVSSAFANLLANLACDGGFEMLDTLTGDVKSASIEEKRRVWVAVVTSGADCSQPLMHIPAQTDDGLQTMVGIKSHGMGAPYVSKFPLSWPIYRALDEMIASVTSKSDITVQGVLGLIVSNAGLSTVLHQINSQSLIECYIHDFIRMAYLPAHGSPEEFKVFEVMLQNECYRQDLGLSPRSTELGPDAPGAFASIHSAWLRFDIAASVLHLRAIFLELPAVAESLSVELIEKRLCPAGHIERLALEHVLRVLVPCKETLGQRCRVSAWTASVRILRPVAEAILSTHCQDVGYCRSARNGFDRLRIASMYAEVLQIGSWQDIAKFWEQVVCDLDLSRPGSLKKIVCFLVSHLQSLGPDKEPGAFVAKLVDDFFGDEFVNSDEIMLNSLLEIELSQAAGQKLALSLGPKSKVSIIRKLVDFVYSADSKQPIRTAAEARLHKLLSRLGGEIDSREEVARVFIRACEDFVALRFGASPAQVLAWAQNFLPRNDAPVHHLFGIVCAQACFAKIVDVLFAAQNLVSVELPAAAALCSRRSSYRDACQRFLVEQVLRRCGARALCRLSSHRKLQWVRGFVEPAMLIDRADLFLVHGSAYSQLRDQQLLRCELDRSSDPALSILALFNDATARALDPASQADVPAAEADAGPTPAKQQLAHQGRTLLSGVPCGSTVAELLAHVEANTLGGAEPGLHRAVLTLGSGQPEAGALIHQVLLHVTVAAAVGGALAQPFRDLLVSPGLMSGLYVPAAPSFEDQRAAMHGTTGVTKWYVCPNGHPYAVGDCGRFSAGGRCICGAAIGGVRGYGTEQAADLPPPNLAEDERGFPRAIHPLPGPCSILSRDEAMQQQGWSEPLLDRWGAQRGLTASAAAVLRVMMHALLLSGAAMCPRRAVEAAALLNLHLDDTEDGGVGSSRVGHILAALTEQLCAEMVCLRQLVACSPEDTAVLLHCACQRMIETARAEPGGGDSAGFDLSTKDGRTAWENTFARRILSPILEAVESTVALHRSALGKARSSHQRLRNLLEGGEDSVSGRAWAYRAPVTLDLCHRHLERVSTDARYLPILREYLSRVRLLRHLRHLVPVARFCATLCASYGQAAMTVAEARAVPIGDVLRGPGGEELASGVAAFRAAWEGLRDYLPGLIPAAVAGFLGKVLAAPPEEYGLGGGAAGFGALGDDTPLTFFLPDQTREGVCAVALLVALARVQNHFLDAHRETLLSRYGAHVDQAPTPLAQLGPSDVLGCRVRSEILPLLLAAAEHVAERGRPTGGEAVRWDMEGLELSLVRACVVGRRVIDEASVPRAVFVGRVCDGAALDRLRAAGLSRPLPRSLWRPVVAELLSHSGVVAALSAVETAASFLAASPAADPGCQLTAYLRNVLLMPAGAPLVSGSGPAQQLELGHVVELRARLDLTAALQELEGGADPFAEGAGGEQGRLEAGARLKVETWARGVSRWEADRLLLELRELLTVRLPTLQPEWKLRDALLAHLDTAGMEGGDADLAAGAAAALPDFGGVAVRQGGHVWRVLALRWIDDYLAADRDVPSHSASASGSGSRGQSASATAGAATASAPACDPALFRMADLTCRVGEAVEHRAEWSGQGEPGWDSVEVIFRPPLPAGLVFGRGAVRGRATTPKRSCVHIASARGVGWARAARTEVVLTVLAAPPPCFTYAPLVCTAGVPLGLSTAAPRFADGGMARADGDVQFAVSPALPRGLFMNPQTGIIGGTAGAACDEVWHVVTCSGEGGTSEARMSLKVLARAPGRFKYATLQCTLEVAIAPHAPNPLDDGPVVGAGIAYRVDPPLLAGLVLNPANGVITGAPAAADDAKAAAAWPLRTLHTVTAENASGSVDARLAVEVRGPADFLQALRPLLRHGSPAWAGSEWVFAVGGMQCRCPLQLGGLALASVGENPAARPGQPLYERFAAAHARAQDKRVALCFHGTAAENLDAICAGGLDPARRKGQSMGPGEYFATEAQVSLSYCRQGKTLLLFAVLLDPAGLTANNGKVLVVHRTDHQLPLCVVTVTGPRN